LVTEPMKMMNIAISVFMMFVLIHRSRPTDTNL
jgi:hypothetical protein